MITIFLNTELGCDTVIKINEPTDIKQLIETLEQRGCVVYSIMQDEKTIYEAAVSPADLYDVRDLYVGF